MKRILLIIILFLPCHCMAQTDTVFWFAPPDLSNSFGEKSARLVFHTYDRSATVSVQQPANPSFPAASFSIGSHGLATYDLSTIMDLIETAPTNTVLNRGFRISSTAPITCYYQSTSNNRQTYTLKGRNALGTEFSVISPVTERGVNTSERDIGMSLEMIATEDSTLVTITAPHVWEYQWDGTRWQPVDTIVEEVLEGGIVEDSTFQISLNRGQSYALRAKHFNYNLWGTQIRSTKPVAVNITADQFMSSTVPPTYNLVGEQLVPNAYWGSRYATISLDFPNEQIGCYRTDSNVSPEYFTDSSNSSIHYLRGNGRLGVGHQIFRNQMGYTILPQLDCSGSRQVSYLHSDSLNLFVNILIDSSYIDGLRFNGNSSVFTRDRFQPVPDCASLAWCAVQVDQYLPTDSVMTVTCDSGTFVLYVVESDSLRGTSYTCLTDYAPYTYISFDMKTEYCTGGSIVFQCNQNNIDSLVVYGPNGTLTTTLPYQIPSADSTLSGQYIVEGYSNSSCVRSFRDTILITVYAPLADTIYDTITESQLPWQRFGLAFTGDADTVIYRNSPAGVCDSIHHYHLRVGLNSHDTVIYYSCPGEMPLTYDTINIYSDTTCDFHYIGSMGQDSVITLVLHVMENSDSTIFDTIIDLQLPWTFMGIPFEDTVSNYTITTNNEQGCDSIIHYNLYIYWNGDHCDTTLTYPNIVTPNGDGTNDKFIIIGLLENNCFKYNTLSIYDRTGRRVYHKTNITSEADWWDPSADRMPSGTYFYYFRAHGINIHTQHTGVIEVLHEK